MQAGQIRPTHPEFDRPSDRGAELERIDACDYAGEAHRERLLQALAHLVPLLQPLRHHDRLGKGVVRQGDVDRQIEADGALPDIGREPHHVRIGADDLVERCRHIARGVDRGVVLQLQVHQQFRPIRRRKKLLRNETNSIQRRPEQADGDQDGDPFRPHRHQQTAAVQTHRRAQRLAVRMLRLAQQRQADDRRADARHHPGRQQRKRHHGEQGKRVLAGVAAGKADRHESSDGHQSSSKPRISHGVIGENRGLLFGVAAFQAAHHAFDSDHRIIHKKAERDDESAKRDTLEVDGEHPHCREHDRENERDRDHDDRARAQPEADHAHHQNDGDGLPQRFHEIVDRMVDGIWLVGDHHRLDADRQIGLQLLHGLLDVVPPREHVAAVAHRNRQAQASPTVQASG